MNLILSILYIVGLYSAYLAGSLYLRTQAADPESASPRSSKGVPYTTLFIALAIAIPSTLQFFFPALLQLLERNYLKFIAGEWWRLLTSLFVQDGGIGGTIFNLVSLLLIGTVAEKLWGSQRWIIIFFAGGILSQFVGFLWQPLGAGNSVGNFSLAASLAVISLPLSRSPAVRMAAILALGTGGMLLLFKDIHGAATVLGAGIALILLRLHPYKFNLPE
jgi:membrane associated rhomboid family serine protease